MFTFYDYVFVFLVNCTFYANMRRHESVFTVFPRSDAHLRIVAPQLVALLTRELREIVAHLPLKAHFRACAPQRLALKRLRAGVTALLTEGKPTRSFVAAGATAAIAKRKCGFAEPRLLLISV